MPYRVLKPAQALAHFGRLAGCTLSRGRLRRTEFAGRVAFQPIDENIVHPAFFAHARHLAHRTLIPRPGAVIHFINRRYSRYSGDYLAEPEHLYAVAPLKHKKDADVNEALAFIEEEVESGRLKRIVFQSPGALEVASKVASRSIRQVCSAVQLVPAELDLIPPPALREDGTPLRILVVAGRPWSKGVFLLPPLLERLRREGRVELTCITATPFSPLNELEGTTVIVKKSLSEAERTSLFSEADVSLNLSLRESLGFYLDSTRFNRPMVTLWTQHCKAFIDPRSTGAIVPNPFYYLDPSRYGVDWKNEREFDVAIQGAHHAGEFEPTLDALVDCLKPLIHDPGLARAMGERQRAKAHKDLGVAQWLKTWSSLYQQVSE